MNKMSKKKQKSARKHREKSTVTRYNINEHKALTKLKRKWQTNRTKSKSNTVKKNTKH